jgi:hypothetical protein
MDRSSVVDAVESIIDTARKNIKDDRLNLVPININPYFYVTIAERYNEFFPGEDYREAFLNVNRYGLRSDEFIREHDGMHVLFAGCSFTMAEGLRREDGWAYQVYRHISKESKTSGYFNIGICGASFTRIINQIYAYIDEFGIPDKLFVFFPDLGRERMSSDRDLFVDKEWHDKSSIRAMDSKANTPVSMTVLKEHLDNFETTCKLLGIDLYVSSWTYVTDYGLAVLDFVNENGMINPLEHLKTNLIKVDFQENKEYNRLARLYDKFDYSNPFMEHAMDNAHPGIVDHTYFAEKFIEEYDRRRDV